MKELTHEQRLDIISRAWGRKQDDAYYCFFPWINRDEQATAGTRRAGYHEGPAFEWPKDRDKIISHMREHQNDDLYWCPSLFEYPERLTEWAADERALWADLDEVDPRTLVDYPPTTAWETSPGRYQALWILNQGDIRGASWEGNENQALTYYLGADQSGWDTTQLLRVPAWANHKLNYRDKKGSIPKGKLLWKNRRFYQPDDFEDLPKLERQSVTADAIAANIDSIDRSKIMAEWRTKIPKRIREALNAREAAGDRSSMLWDIERSLSDIGCSVEEIVVLVRGSVWNKYDGRSDELKRLVQEAAKAISQRPTEVTEALEEASEEKGIPSRWSDFLRNVRKPEMLVKDVLSKGKVGFIAGEPKSWKSWFAIDLALSVATGARFLDYFDVLESGPVLYIQEEDDPSTVKSRGDKVWRGKKADRVRIEKDGSIVWEPGDLQLADFNPDIDVYMQHGFTVSEPEWQEWLSDVLREGQDGRPYVLVIIDTLMMSAGDVEENRAQEMTTKIFRPTKTLARDHGVAILFVHHLRKGGDESTRAGQLMLGSVANHAWSENSIYVRRMKTGDLKVEVESKFFPGEEYRVGGIARRTDWAPVIQEWDIKADLAGGNADLPARVNISPALRVLKAAAQPMTNAQIGAATGQTYNQVWRVLKRAISKGQVEKVPGGYTWI